MIADVTGKVPVDGTDPLVPARLLETRTGEQTVDGRVEAQGRAARSTNELLVAGRGGVRRDASTVVLNVGRSCRPGRLPHATAPVERIGPWRRASTTTVAT